ncbi:uncharacterized protein K452DRAFT_301847 [Aplosporella prunicola CBS 121167]|uniref:Uncharacterized protein n=1 Tax=Aplosporella prunicola CBS 121167 TaxID=1176127 RepID=A0A6A6B1I1_9PEZI|nr:uncharacterized protein K452DRAFT_301847 [Aplosporella prunicola CBS 121167]KAF2137676.1 hypothetical protein K452DRAFT_301847 [Aplosporella prunicola CBS 121167]
MTGAGILLGSIATLSLLVQGALLDNTCRSYGMDFQNGQSYFQNSLSTDPFTFVQQFEGCQKDISNNLLVDPSGDQIQCSDTPLQPDDTDQMSTCPILKNQLVSGDWSIIIISNNGDDGEPIAYQRDFSLNVGPQSTTIVTPTVPLTTTSTPVISAVTTETDIVNTTLPPSTTTVPQITIMKTVTTTPKRVTITNTVTLATITIPRVSLSVVKSFVTKTASCHLPQRQPSQDPPCKIKPTIAGVTASAMETATSAKFRQVRDIEHSINNNITHFLMERRERLAAAHALEKRAPDVETLTVTETNTARWTTTTTVVTAPAITVYSTFVVNSTSTVTPPPITVLSGKTVLPPVTITAPTPTRTKTRFEIARTTITKSQTLTWTITTTTTPAASKTACRKAGGVFYRN